MVVISCYARTIYTGHIESSRLPGYSYNNSNCYKENTSMYDQLPYCAPPNHLPPPSPPIFTQKYSNTVYSMLQKVGLEGVSNAALTWTDEYGVSYFTPDELHSNNFTTCEHHLWTRDFLSGSIFTMCENRQKMDKGHKAMFHNKLTKARL